METRRTDPNHDPLPIVEDDQQLYDWGIEHRLDQYYGESQAPPAHGAPAHYQSQYNQTAQTAQQPHSASPASSPCKPNTVGYVLPEHVQRAQENAAYLVTTMGSANNDQKSIKQTTVLPISPPLHGGQLLVKSENNYKRNFHKPLNIKPNGVPGRRPILPTVDMDANEVLKVERKRARNRVAASKCRMRKLERISVLDHQANQLRTENEQLVKLADKLRSQVYSLKQELRWHINNGCRLQSPVLDQLDHPNQQEFLVPTTLDKATETSMTNAQYEMYEDSPDSTTSSTSTSVSIKQEPGYDEAHQRVAI